MKKITFLILCLYTTLFSYGISRTHSGHHGNRSWTILQSWDIPGKASGLAWDGTYLYFGIYGSNGDHFYRFDPATGTSQLQFVNTTINDCYGLTWDGNALWVTDHGTPPADPAEAIQLDLTGTILSTFNLPDHYMSGIAYDAGDFWVGTYYPDPGTIYKVDNTGTILSQFTPPNNQIWDICMQDNDLWMVDYDANMIYKTTPTGTVLESHASENIKPAGVVYDGNYLWYVDGQISSPSKLYKVSLTGAGTPEITIPVEAHDYGVVTVGSSETWNMEVQNTGDADLEITNIVIPDTVPIFTSFVTPQTITPGNSLLIPLTYTPTEIGTLDAIVSIESTDPIHPSVDVHLTGNAVNAGPSIQIAKQSHDYGNIRMNAFTRWFLNIKNYGDQTLTVSDITSDDSAFIVDASVSFPINIATLDSVLIGVWFHPIAPESYHGNLSVINNDTAHSPLTISLDGEGILQNYPIGQPLWSDTINDNDDNSPKAIVPLQDITGDTISEVVVGSDDNHIRCYNGNSSGTADRLWDVEIFSGAIYDQPGLKTIADIDGDGYADLIVGTAWGDRSVRALSGKTGTLIWRHNTHEYGGGGWVYDVDASRDYNGDGIHDVLAAVGDDGNRTGPDRVYCLNATNGLSIWETYIGGPVFSVISAQDFTGDGIPDVIAGASSSDESQGKVVGIDGSNGNIIWTRNVGGSSVWALLQLDDITGDGIDDVAVGDFAGNYYFINPVDNSILHSGSLSGSILLRFDRLEDVNGDGYADILVAHSQANGVVLNGYDGTFVWYKPLADKSWNVAVIGDLDKDDVNDVVIGTLYNSNYCYFLSGKGGKILKSFDYGTPVDAINSIPDIVGDGTMEMVAGGRDGVVTCFSGGFHDYVGVKEKGEKGTKGSILNVYPNPFTSKTTINIHLEKASSVLIRIVDLNGNTVRTFAKKQRSEGFHSFIWNGTDDAGKTLPCSFYIVDVTTENGHARMKIAKQ